MVEQVYKNIYKILVPLPGNPLKSLNSYVIEAENSGRHLLIDTGFNRPECFDVLLQGLEELGISPADTDVFLTHLHSDHAGNAGALQDLGARVVMSSKDYHDICTVNWDKRGKWYISEGMQEDVCREVLANNPAILFRPRPFDAITVEDGDVLEYGWFKLKCIEVPGHTRGQICLYCEEEKLLFAGDHVLFDITPNICSMGPDTNMLGNYLKSLEKVRELDVELVLPAHRGMGDIDMYQRIESLKKHHRERLDETESIVQANPGQTAYDIAGKMSWAIRTKNWEEFPPGQKWFAMGEALAHLDLLKEEGRIIREEKNGVFFYSPLKNM